MLGYNFAPFIRPATKLGHERLAGFYQLAACIKQQCDHFPHAFVGDFVADGLVGRISRFIYDWKARHSAFNIVSHSRPFDSLAAILQSEAS